MDLDISTITVMFDCNNEQSGELADYTIIIEKASIVLSLHCAPLGLSQLIMIDL